MQRKSQIATAHVTERRVAHPAQGAGARWHALHLRSRFEFTVRDLLRAARIEEFLPTYSEETRWSDRTNLTTRPLFAGYIFARFAAADAPQVLATRGVVQILSTDQQPTPIADDVIAALQRIDGSRAKAVSACPYVPGDEIVVARGPFAGTRGAISRVKGATCLTIPVSILGRAVSVAIDAADVEQPK